MIRTVIKCSSCGKVFHQLNELSNVKNYGLAMFGNCTCGAFVACAELWHFSEKVSLSSADYIRINGRQKGVTNENRNK